MCSPPPHSYLVPWFPPTSPPFTLHPIEVRLLCPDSVRLSTWCVVVSSWSYSSQFLEIVWIQKSMFIPLYFISLQSIYQDLFWFLCIYFAKQSECFFINSLGNSRNFWHYQWPEEFIKQKKPAIKWHQIALYERWICFVYFSVQTTVLFWNPSYYYWDIVKENDHLHIWMPKIDT